MDTPQEHLWSGSPGGVRSAHHSTDIVLSLDRRTGLSDDGHLQRKGMFGNLPAGEDYVARSRRSETGRSSSMARSEAMAY